jgi:hypothetical protein
MISKPTTSVMVSVVRKELKKIAGAVTKEQAVSFAMIDSILNAIEVRAGNEISWMLDEITEIEDFAERTLSTIAEGGEPIRDALRTLRSQRHPSLQTDDVAAEYDLASRLFSLCLENSLEAGGELRADGDRLMGARIKREIQILGEFSLAGRT